MSDKLRMYNAAIESLHWYPLRDEPGGKSVLILTSRMTKELAEALKVKGLCYDEQGTPRHSFEGKVGLAVQIAGADVELGDRRFRSELIHKLKVGRKEKPADNDVSLHLTLRAHFTGDQQTHLAEWARDTGAGEFSFIVDPDQGAFEFVAGKDAAEPEEESEPGQEPIEEHLQGEALAGHKRGRRKRETVGAAE